MIVRHCDCKVVGFTSSASTNNCLESIQFDKCDTRQLRTFKVLVLFVDANTSVEEYSSDHHGDPRFAVDLRWLLWGSRYDIILWTGHKQMTQSPVLRQEKKGIWEKNVLDGYGYKTSVSCSIDIAMQTKDSSHLWGRVWPFGSLVETYMVLAWLSH